MQSEISAFKFLNGEWIGVCFEAVAFDLKSW